MVNTTEYSEAELERDVQARGLTGPRVTPGQLDGKIRGELYHVFPGTTLTVCCLILENGFAVTGQSAAASPGNFDEEIGRQVARADAREKVWQLEGYLLRENLHRRDGRTADAARYLGPAALDLAGDQAGEDPGEGAGLRVTPAGLPRRIPDPAVARLARLQAGADESRCDRVSAPVTETPEEDRGPCAACGAAADVRVSLRLDGAEMFFAFACPRHHDEDLRVVFA